ncbi:uncharacterized protein LOC116769285 [Danaus plexippus]|nr:uncharacterized protein LOC116769285 [Danaus plexippus]
MLSAKAGKVALALLSIAFASHVMYTYYKNRKKSRKPNINEVLMFSYDQADLRKSKFSRCMITRSMDRLLYYLNSTYYSIDICMYVLTNTDLINIIVQLNTRGVKIRMIMDADMAFTNGSSLRRLEKQGIPVRWMKSTNLMHHKFCIIDNLYGHLNPTVEPLVIMGSLNWTNQAVNGNWEDVMVTSQEDIVTQYQTEFDRLWLQFKSIVDIA